MGTSQRQEALSIMVCLALISLFSFAFFFLLFRYAGLIFLVLFAVVAFLLVLSTPPKFQTRSTIPNHILSVNIFNNEYRTIWGLNRPCHGFRRHLDE